MIKISFLIFWFFIALAGFVEYTVLALSSKPWQLLLIPWVVCVVAAYKVIRAGEK